MIRLTNTFKLLILIVLTTGFVACSDDDDNGNIIEPESNTIVDIVADSDDFDVLFAAVVKADLAATLSSTDNTNLTVFAPTDAAFVTYLDVSDEAAAISTINSLDADVVANLLLNHVLGSAVASSEITTGYQKALSTNADGDNLDLYLEVANGTVSINGVAKVTTPDVEADNGVIHVVDAVIPEATVVTFVTADPNFSSLAAALTRESSFNYVATLSTPEGTAPAPFTVFAPTNAAFTALIAELDGINALADIPTVTLQATLNLHVIAGANIRSTDLTSGAATTLGGDVTIDASAGTITDANGRVSTLVVTDIQASNGVVHSIDKVLLPAL